MSGHTPGPWVWTDMDQLIAPNRSVIDVIVETDSGVYPPHGADRHLIAAAPELYEALADCYVLALAWASTYAESHGLPMGEQAEPHATILKNSRAALRKAEGK